MPVLTSYFSPPAFLSNGHLQTILPVIFPRRLHFRTQYDKLELADGDFLELNWLRQGRDRLAIISHGLEGSSREGYIKGMALALSAAGYDILAWNFRGCGKEPNRLPRFYHGGDTGDLKTLINLAGNRYQNIALVGFSLGGNMTLKYLGEAPPHPSIKNAAVVSVPIDLASTVKALDRHLSNRIYLRRFLKTLVAKMENKAQKFPGMIPTDGLRGIRGFTEFDDRYIARLHGFKDGLDYWNQSSA